MRKLVVLFLFMAGVGKTNAQSLINSYAFGVDPDASAYIASASITNQTQKNAIDRLVKDLKNYGIWDKCYAIYPFLGGTAVSHKINLKDPRDVDAAFRLTFVGSWTHSSTGATPSNAYADTYLKPSLIMAQNDKHLSFWSRTSGVPSVCVIGATNSDGSGGDMLVPNYSGNDNYSSLSSASNSKATGTTYNGFHLVTRSTSTACNYFRNGTNKFTETITSSINVAQNYYIGARNYGGSAIQNTSHECAFASIGRGLSDTEVANFYSAVSTYQTSISR